MSNIFDFFSGKKTDEQIAKINAQIKEAQKDEIRKAEWKLAEFLRENPRARAMQEELDKELLEIGDDPNKRLDHIVKKLNSNLMELKGLLIKVKDITNGK